MYYLTRVFRVANPLGTAFLLLLLNATSGLGTVNPSLQPQHLFERYLTVIGGEVTAADEQRIIFKPLETFKGSFGPSQVTVHLSPPGTGDPGEEESIPHLGDVMSPGEPLVAFVGSERRRGERSVLIYAGQHFYQAEIVGEAEAATWKCEENLGDQMWGTFNGNVRNLMTMMRDAKNGVVFFPSKPFEKFQPDFVIDRFPSAITAVAIYDINADGALDLYACNPTGNRLYLQNTGMKFEDKTTEYGLHGVVSNSCNFADVNGDGRADLLAGGRIYLGADGRFNESSILSGCDPSDVLSSGYLEVNGDGFPDVLLSTLKQGLRLFLNPGTKGGEYIEVSDASGLREGNAAAGYFAWGDWNGDGRCDIFHAAGAGTLLTQNKTGKFQSLPHSLGLRFRTGLSQGDVQTGGSSFSPILGTEALDLVIPSEERVILAADIKGQVVDVTQFGNELNETYGDQRAVLSTDLNMDGRLDLYILTHSTSTPLRVMINRGYGSFMNPENYSKEGFPGEAHQKGVTGATSGDVNNDGATDLLIGGADGVLSLMVNDTLSLRKPQDSPNHQDRILLQTKILSVRVAARVGALGADVRVLNDRDQIVARRIIGADGVAGCRGPDTLDLAVREPGRYRVQVRFSDGHVQTWQVDLANTSTRAQLNAFRSN